MYSNAEGLARTASEAARTYLGMRIRRGEIESIIAANPLPAFCVFPISCRAFPAIFFLAPYPKDLIHFLSHTAAHEVFHLKLAFSKTVPYFVESEAYVYFEKAGFSAFLLDEFFPQIIEKFSAEKTMNLVNDVSERLRDFRINKELAMSREFSKITLEWELRQTRKNVASVLRKLRRVKSDYIDYDMAIDLLDLGMRRALLQDPAVFEEMKTGIPSGLARTTETISEMFDTSNATDPHKMKQFIESFCDICGFEVSR
jgi:hypothetical protein